MRPIDHCAPLSEPLSRKQFLRRSAAFAAGIAAVSILDSSPVSAEDDSLRGRHRRIGEPRPIPGGFGPDFSFMPHDPFIHVLPPAIGLEMSTITDFNGVVAAAEVQGTAQGSDGSAYWFDADMRTMNGVYIDIDGRHREHAFGFI